MLHTFSLCFSVNMIIANHSIAISLYNKGFETQNFDSNLISIKTHFEGIVARLASLFCGRK